MIEGLSHLTFIVSDLDRMTTLVKTVFDAQEVYSSGDQTFSLSREKFFVLGGVWIAVVDGGWTGRSGPLLVGRVRSRSLVRWAAARAWCQAARCTGSRGAGPSAWFGSLIW